MVTKARAALVLLAVWLSAATALGTVDAAAWRREILVGANKDSYFVWVLRWNQHEGSAYPYSESISLERRALADRAVLEAHDVTAAGLSADEDSEAWKREPELVPLFDVTTYLRENDVSPAFSVDTGCDASFREGALVFTRGEAVASILDADEVRARLGAWGEEPRVVGGCQVLRMGPGSATDIRFYTIQLNEAADDVDWLELLLPVPDAKVRAAVARLELLRN